MDHVSSLFHKHSIIEAGMTCSNLYSVLLQSPAMIVVQLISDLEKTCITLDKLKHRFGSKETCNLFHLSSVCHFFTTYHQELMMLRSFYDNYDEMVNQQINTPIAEKFNEPVKLNYFDNRKIYFLSPLLLDEEFTHNTFLHLVETSNDLKLLNKVYVAFSQEIFKDMFRSGNTTCNPFKYMISKLEKHEKINKRECVLSRFDLEHNNDFYYEETFKIKKKRKTIRYSSSEEEEEDV